MSTSTRPTEPGVYYVRRPVGFQSVIEVAIGGNVAVMGRDWDAKNSTHIADDEFDDCTFTRLVPEPHRDVAGLDCDAAFDKVFTEGGYRYGEGPLNSARSWFRKGWEALRAWEGERG